MAHQLCHGSHVLFRPERVCGEGMAQIIGPYPPSYARPFKLPMPRSSQSRYRMTMPVYDIGHALHIVLFFPRSEKAQDVVFYGNLSPKVPFCFSGPQERAQCRAQGQHPAMSAGPQQGARFPHLYGPQSAKFKLYDVVPCLAHLLRRELAVFGNPEMPVEPRPEFREGLALELGRAGGQLGVHEGLQVGAVGRRKGGVLPPRSLVQ